MRRFSQANAAMRLLERRRRSEFALTACSRVTLCQNARADRDVDIVVAHIITAYRSRDR